MYRRCPSAKRVSKASELLPEPLNPVMTMRWLSGRSRSKFFRLLCRTPRRRITELADGFDMQAECNGADLRVNEQIVLRRTPIASRLQNNLPRQRAGPANRAFLLQPM